MPAFAGKSGMIIISSENFIIGHDQSVEIVFETGVVLLVN